MNAGTTPYYNPSKPNVPYYNPPQPTMQGVFPKPPQFNSQFLTQLMGMMPRFTGFNPVAPLPGDVQNLITTQTNAEARRLFDQNKIGLYDRGFESGSEDIRTGSEIASNLAAKQAQMELDARFRQGEGSLAALTAGAGAAGAGAGIESNVYGTQADMWGQQFKGILDLLQMFLPFMQQGAGGVGAGGVGGGGNSQPWAQSQFGLPTQGGPLGVQQQNPIMQMLMMLFGGQGGFNATG